MDSVSFPPNENVFGAGGAQSTDVSQLGEHVDIEIEYES